MSSNLKVFYMVVILLIIGVTLIWFLLNFVFFPCRNIKLSLRPRHFQETEKLPQLEKALAAHVKTIAQTIGERNLYNRENLFEAANYIRNFWKKFGLNVQVQTYDFNGNPYQNIWMQIDGKQNPEEVILVGAHYDSVVGSPGADDNASGVGALLEISRIFHKSGISRRSIRFVAFTNEEPPFFKSSHMGSHVYARQVAKNQENIVAMINLESLGYFVEKSGTQKYPPFFNLFFPDKGNFIGVVGNIKSRSLVQRVTKYFKESVEFPCECIVAPNVLRGIDWSDHASFWEYGYPAVMVTDTVPYRNPHYHQSTDKPETLNYSAYAKTVIGLTHVIYRLAND